MNRDDPSDDPGREEAVELDRVDLLAGFRSRFAFPDPELVYLDGNSLSRAPIDASDRMKSVVDGQWADRLIRSWNDGWWELHLRLGDMIAPVVGAGPGEVMVSDSTSVNLFKLAFAAMKSRPGRHRIVTDDLNFPTDVYVLESVARLFAGTEVVVVESDGIHGPLDQLAGLVDEDTALLALSHTVFKSGFTYDMAGMTALAHEAGAMTLWDTSHSVGVVPIDLTGAGVDLAVGCTYKYLNGGPGSPAFLYVRPDLVEELENPISAWWAHESPFDFDLSFRPTTGIRRFHTGTMPILSLAAMESGIALVVDAGVERIRVKSIELGEFFVRLHDRLLAPLGFELRSPRNPHDRGAHVSLGHPDAWPITRALVEKALVVPDFRAPDNLRLGFSPLYTSFVDVQEAVRRIQEVVVEGYEDFAAASAEVT